MLGPIGDGKPEVGGQARVAADVFDNSLSMLRSMRSGGMPVPPKRLDDLIERTWTTTPR